MEADKLGFESIFIAKHHASGLQKNKFRIEVQGLRQAGGYLPKTVLMVSVLKDIWTGLTDIIYPRSVRLAMKCGAGRPRHLFHLSVHTLPGRPIIILFPAIR